MKRIKEKIFIINKQKERNKNKEMIKKTSERKKGRMKKLARERVKWVGSERVSKEKGLVKKND